MVEEGRRIASLAPNLVVKVPVTLEGIQAIRMLAKDGIPVNATLVFQPLQALLAARAGAKYASVFLGRLETSATMPFLSSENALRFWRFTAWPRS